MRDVCAVVGIGNTTYTRGTERSVVELHLEASLRALADAGLEARQVDGIVPSSVADRVAEDFIRNLGIRNLGFSSTPHAGGSSYVMGIQEACMAIHAGVARCVEKALAGAPAPMPAVCSATLVHGPKAR